MKLVRPERKEWIAFAMIIPLLCLIMNYLLFGDRLFNDYRVLLYSFPVVFVLAAISWYLRTSIMHRLRIRYPHFSQTLIRLSLLGATHIVIVSFTMFLIFYGYDLVGYLDYRFEPDQFRTSVVLGLTITLLATTFWEGDYTFQRWKESVAENHQLEQLTIKHEFESLKSQVNPHFLFNCFNTLSSLIAEDKKAAESFLNELSKVYRYLLRSNESGLSTLENELKFIQSYYELLKMRYGNALQLEIAVNKKYDQYLLPSLSLQLLVENAVKHNVVSRHSPLVIEIFTTAGHKLLVNNNIQPKPVKAPSNKIGLENIRSKYGLLGQSGFQIINDAKGFCVVLPLVWNRSVEEKIAELI